VTDGHQNFKYRLDPSVAKSRGVRFGRPRKLTAEQTKLVRRLIEEGRAVREVAETFNVHVATIYRVSTP
jgi:DNA invertase Pin-like site-specific DNA recombinase